MIIFSSDMLLLHSIRLQNTVVCVMHCEGKNYHMGCADNKDSIQHSQGFATDSEISLLLHVSQSD